MDRGTKIFKFQFEINMNHLEYIKSSCGCNIPFSFGVKSTGKFYTPDVIANRIFDLIFDNITIQNKKNFSIVDPFAGDGRMACWFINRWIKKCLPKVNWNVHLYDIEMEGLKLVSDQIENLKKCGASVSAHIHHGDSFRLLCDSYDEYDFVLTNPPWELIKPDTRELSFLDDDIKSRYITEMKSYDLFLAQEYPLSQPKTKYAGWGTNLSRVGLELAHRICKPNGFCGIVLPASFFADEQSQGLRDFLLIDNKLIDISYYPSGAKLFSGMDFDSCSLVYEKEKSGNKCINITIFDEKLNTTSSDSFRIKESCPIPITMGVKNLGILEKMQAECGTWGEAEQNGRLWAGRELDQTGIDNFLKPVGNGYLFIKGRMIGRYEITEQPSLNVCKNGWTPPQSCDFHRIAWRDVSRPSQKRRVIATVIPPKIIAGNSLGVAYIRKSTLEALYSLLGVMNSLCFEFQLKNYLATGHISLSSLRRVAIPDVGSLSRFKKLSEYVAMALCGNKKNIDNIEAYVARNIYKLSEFEFNNIINSFTKISAEERNSLIKAYAEESCCDV